MKVLLVGDNDRSALSACRALGESGAGIEVGVASADKRGLARTSRFCRSFHRIGDPTENFVAVSVNLTRVAAAYDVVIPLTDAACLLCFNIRQDVEADTATRIALPRESTWDLAFNKKTLINHCQTLGIPVPEDGDIDQPPVYLKPVSSALVRNNRLLSFTVKRAVSRVQAEDFLREHTFIEVMVQKECPGQGVGIYLLADSGKIISMVQQNRLHEPEGGGGSSYRETVAIDHDLRSYTEKLIKSICWTGVAMVEFKGSPGSWRIMELNGRFWGSLALTIAAGCNFPFWLVQLTQGESVEAKGPRLGVRQRHLGKDLMWAWRQRQPTKWATELLTHRAGLDVEHLKDPYPALNYWICALRPLVNWMHRKAIAVCYRMLQPQLHLRVVNRLAGGDANVLFACRGNICRSPFAEAFCREKLGWNKVLSCGTFPRPERRVPKIAESVAQAEFGLDLSEHGSTVVDEQLLCWADIVFVMDYRQFAELYTRMDSAVLVLLGGATEIVDPYRGDEGTFLASFRKIAKYCKELDANIPYPAG